MRLPNDFPKEEHFQDSLVAFLDILGFTDRVRKLSDSDDFHRVARVLYVLKREADSWTKASEPIVRETQMSAMSDSVVVSMPYENEAAIYLVASILHQLQYALIADEEHTLLRGYLARGLVYHRDGILFGPGYLDAYAGESKKRGPARIVIDGAIAAKAVELTIRARGDGRGSVLDFLRCDTDGSYFIDYLKPIGAVAKYPERGRELELAEIARFAGAQFRRQASTPGIQEKYVWLLGYVDTIRREFYPSKGP